MDTEEDVEDDTEDEEIYSKRTTFSVGTHVIAPYEDSSSKYPGIIYRNNHDGTYDIMFDDGGRDSRVLGTQIEKNDDLMDFDDIDSFPVYSVRSQRKRKHSTPTQYVAEPASRSKAGDFSSNSKKKYKKDTVPVTCNVGDIVIDVNNIHFVLSKNYIYNKNFISKCNLMFYAGRNAVITEQGNITFECVCYPLKLDETEKLSSSQYKFNIDYSSPINKVPLDSICNFVMKCSKRSKLCNFTFISNKAVIIEL